MSPSTNANNHGLLGYVDELDFGIIGCRASIIFVGVDEMVREDDWLIAQLMQARRLALQRVGVSLASSCVQARRCAPARV